MSQTTLTDTDAWTAERPTAEDIQGTDEVHPDAYVCTGCLCLLTPDETDEHGFSYCPHCRTHEHATRPSIPMYDAGYSLDQHGSDRISWSADYDGGGAIRLRHTSDGWEIREYASAPNGTRREHGPFEHSDDALQVAADIRAANPGEIDPAEMEADRE